MDGRRNRTLPRGMQGLEIYSNGKIWEEMRNKVKYSNENQNESNIAEIRENGMA